MQEETQWIKCPKCGKQTRVKVKETTVIKDFPLYKGGKEVRKIFWETQSSVETLVCLSQKA